MWTCERCGFEATTMGRLESHIDRKRRCKALLKDLTAGELMQMLRARLTCEHCGRVHMTEADAKVHRLQCPQRFWACPAFRGPLYDEGALTEGHVRLLQAASCCEAGTMNRVRQWLEAAEVTQ